MPKYKQTITVDIFRNCHTEYEQGGYGYLSGDPLSNEGTATFTIKGFTQTARNDNLIKNLLKRLNTGDVAVMPNGTCYSPMSHRRGLKTVDIKQSMTENPFWKMLGLSYPEAV